MLAVMHDEFDTDAKIAEAQFKNLVFANNPELYRKLFIEPQRVNEDEIEWLQPKTLGEMERAIEELREAGVDLDFTPSEEDLDFSRFDKIGDDEPIEDTPEPPLHSESTAAGEADFFEALHNEDIE